MSTRGTKVSFICPPQIMRVTLSANLLVMLQQYLCQLSLAGCRIKLYAWNSQSICTVCLLITNSSALCVAVTVICLTGMQNDLLKTYLSNSTMKYDNNDTRNQNNITWEKPNVPHWWRLLDIQACKLIKMICVLSWYVYNVASGPVSSRCCPVLCCTPSSWNIYNLLISCCSGRMVVLFHKPAKLILPATPA